MADGLSIAASVAGLVSLGIQVCSGITTYLDGLKCRAEELEYARRYEQSLRASIRAIENVSPQLLVHHQNSSATIVPCMQLCKDQLEALDRFVAELCGEIKSNPSLRDRAKATKKRLTYAFDRPKLGQLQTKADQAIQNLQLALQILGLESSSLLGSTLRTIESTSNDTAADIIATKAEVTALADDVSALRNEGPFIRAAIDNIGPSLRDLGQTATQTVQGIQVVREDTNRVAHILAAEMQLMRNQLATFQSQNAIAHRTTNQLLQLVQHNQGRLVTQMISRPSYLEEVSKECFDVGPSARDSWSADRTQMSVLTTTARNRESSNSMLPPRYARRCTCRSRHRFQRKQVVWSGFLLYQDSIYSEKHSPTCELWQEAKATERKWGLRQTSLGWLAQKAIEITFSCKFGAGGASFGPSFTYYPTVDEDVAPAFQILQVMENGLNELTKQRQQYSPFYWQRLLEKGFESLETLFREGRASPNDINSSNQTLIYPIVDLVWISLNRASGFAHSEHFNRITFDFLKGIKRLGIPSNIYDNYGESPIENLTFAFYITSIEAVEILYDTSVDVPSRTISPEDTFDFFRHSEYILNSLTMQKESQIIAEAYGCGQLSQAVLAGDIEQVERLLRKSHASLMEVNAWGQTPLHLSVAQPAILQSLLPYYSPSQLNMLDGDGYTALHYAILTGYEICKEESTIRRCRGCHCARPLKMLLKADCAVDIGFLESLKDYDITQRCLRSLIRGFKDRRKRLKQLALGHLSDSDIVALNLGSECVLDAQTATVIGLLEAKRVQIPPALMLTQRDKPAKSNGFPGVSVYHVIRNVDEADLFWSNGFLDFDVFNGYFDEVLVDGLPPIATCQHIDMIMWLFDHGANPLKELEPSNDSADRKSLCVRSAHFVYRKIGNWLQSDINRFRQDILRPLHATVLAVEVLDKCECNCSKQGCTPFLMMVKALSYPYVMEKRRSNILIVEPFLGCLETSSYGFMRNQYKEAVRYFTFTALDMNHTCHHEPANSRDYTCSATIEMCENAIHIQDEQADMVELLEEMLFDLEAKLDNMMEDDEDFDMEMFLKDHWLVRVEKELEAISGHELSENFKKETEALGVVWNEATEATDSDSEDDRPKPLQYWLDAIDRAAQL